MTDQNPATNTKSSYEIMAKLPASEYAEIRVEYHIPADYVDTSTDYTGNPPQLRSLYRGRASATALTSK